MRQFQFGPSQKACAQCGKAMEQCQCSTVKVSAEDQLELVERAAAAAQATVQLKSVEGRYSILEAIGIGGMGTVFRAEHVVLNHQVAIKVLRNELLTDRLAMARFEQEARACAALQHPNLVYVFDCGILRAGSPYLVMEFIEGKSLHDVIRHEGAMEIRRFLDIFIDVCKGLAFAHSHGVIHRDLKPGNILLTEDPSGGRTIPKVVDFGVAKIEDLGGEFQMLTRTGEVFGSPSYMSPEQCHGTVVDQRSDIYALGCVMYEAISGRRAFRGANIMTIMNSQVEDMPPPPGRQHSYDRIPAQLVDAIMKCLEKDPDDRFQQMEELQSELERVRDNMLASRIIDVGRFHVSSERLTGALVGVATLLTVALYPVLLPGGSLSDFFGGFKASRPGRSSTFLSTAALAGYADRDGLHKLADQNYQSLLSGPESRNVGVVDRCAISVLMLFGLYYNGKSKEIVTIYGTTLEPLLAKLDQAIQSDPASQKVAASCAPLIYYYVARAEWNSDMKQDAEKKFLTGIKLSKKLKSPRWVTAKLLWCLGEMYIKSDAYAKAVPNLKESFDLYTHERDWIKEDMKYSIAQVGAEWAVSLDKLAKSSESISALERVIEFEKSMGMSAETTSRTMSRLTEYLEKAHRTEEAKQWSNQLAMLKNKNKNISLGVDEGTVPYTVLLERAQILKNEQLKPYEKPFSEALGRAKATGASDLEICAVASAAMRVYADLSLADDGEQLYDSVKPMLLRVRDSVTDKASNDKSSKDRADYAGTAPMFYYYLAEAERKVADDETNSEKKASRYKKAEAFVSTGLKLCQGLPGNEGVWTSARMEQLLGKIYLGEKKYKEAENLLHKALDTLTGIGGHKHVEVAETYFALAKVLDAQGRYEEAKKAISAAAWTVDGNGWEEWRADSNYWPFNDKIKEHEEASGK